MFNCDSSTNSTFSSSNLSNTSTDSKGCITTYYNYYYINNLPEDFVPCTNFVERFVFKKLVYERRKLRTFYFKKDVRRNRLIDKREKHIGLHN